MLHRSRRYTMRVLRLSMKCRHALLAMVLIVAACGDDGPTGPSADFDIVGEWAWRVDDATGTNATCSVDAVTLTFTRSNGVLSAHRLATADDNITCTANGSNSTSTYTTDAAITDLSLDDTEISYSFPTSTGLWEMSGDIETDNSMGGTATIRLGSSVGTFVLTGPWRATRN
jgi:hypothetical protein